MRRIGCTVAAAALLLTGCGEPSPIEPDQRVVVRGSATAPDGGALAQGRVLVMKEVGPDDFAAEVPLLLGTMGFVCIAGADLAVCDEPAGESELDADGRFSVELDGRDVQSGFGTTSTMWATVRGPDDGGPSASRAFEVGTPEVELPPLQLWDPTVSVESSNGQVQPRWDELPARLGKASSQRAVASTAAGTVLWAFPRREAGVDERVFEDAIVEISAVARVRGDDTAGPVVYRSRHVTHQGPGAPPSRGAGCSAVATKRTTVSYDPCPLTDGDLDTVFSPALDPQCPSDKQCPQHDTGVVVDLGERRRISLVVVRGDDDVLVIETSDDARRWESLGLAELKRGVAIVEPGSRTRARYLRLRAERWPLPDFREVAVW